MAEDEIVKHTKRVYTIWNSKEHSFWHKVREFFIEILIIVFAVSLSIWMHDRSEKAHQQKEVKQFLLGLKEDLTDDIKEMKEDESSYHSSRAAFLYIVHTKLGDTLRQDSIRHYARWINNTTGLVPNSGRFEGFKASGKIGTIENNELQNHIMDLYQENIPQLLLSTNGYTKLKGQLFEYLDKNTRRINNSKTNIGEVLITNESLNVCTKLTFVEEILDRYETCIAKMNLIIREIDKDYPKE